VGVTGKASGKESRTDVSDGGKNARSAHTTNRMEALPRIFINNLPSRGKAAVLIQHYHLVLAASAFMSLTACAGTRLYDIVSSSATEAMEAPQNVAVSIEDESVAPKRASRLATHAADVEFAKAALIDALSKLLAAQGFKIVPVGQGADLLLHAQIKDVRSGNEVLRLTVGYGAGKAALDTVWTLTDLRQGTPARLLSFEIRSTSGALPGAGLGLASEAADSAVTVARSSLAAAGTLRQGIAREANQTSGKINVELKKYFASRRWAYPKS
jgi:hypothetical protein